MDVWAQRESRDLESQMKKLGRIYRAQHQPQKFHYREVKLHAIANCLAEPGEPGHGLPDEVRYELTLEPPEGQPLFAHRLTLSSPVGRSFFGQYRIQLLDQHNASRSIEVLPSFDPENSLFREVMVFFSPPILPGTGACRLSIVDHGRDLFADLRPAGSRREWMSVELGRALPEIGPVKFGLTVPERLRGARPEDHETPGRPLAPGECASAFGLAPVGFDTIGWAMHGREAKPVVRADFTA